MHLDPSNSCPEPKAGTIVMSMPEVASHIEALVVAIEHVHSSPLQPRLPIQLPQQNYSTCKAKRKLGKISNRMGAYSTVQSEPFSQY